MPQPDKLGGFKLPNYDKPGLMVKSPSSGYDKYGNWIMAGKEPQKFNFDKPFLTKPGYDDFGNLNQLGPPPAKPALNQFKPIVYPSIQANPYK
jgi:hypothetical protein